jgi:hypothetical protein
VPGSYKRSNSPNSTISTLIAIPAAPSLTADSYHLNNLIKSETGTEKKKQINFDDLISFCFYRQ